MFAIPWQIYFVLVYKHSMSIHLPFRHVMLTCPCPCIQVICSIMVIIICPVHIYQYLFYLLFIPLVQFPISQCLYVSPPCIYTYVSKSSNNRYQVNCIHCTGLPWLNHVPHEKKYDVYCNICPSWHKCYHTNFKGISACLYSLLTFLRHKCTCTHMP